MGSVILMNANKRKKLKSLEKVIKLQICHNNLDGILGLPAFHLAKEAVKHIEALAKEAEDERNNK